MAKKKDAVQKRTFVGFAPHPGQEEVFNSVVNEDYKYYVLCMGRNWGKTQLCLNLSLFWAINEKGSDILYLGKTNRLAREVYYQTYEILKDCGLIEHNNKTNQEIILINKSKLRFGTGSEPNHWRGFNTLTHAIIDEMSFQHPQLFTHAIQQCLMRNGKKCMMISTPNGFDHFRDQYIKAETEDNYKAFHASSHENIYLPEDALAELDFYKKNNPIIYRVEYLAEFVDEYTGIFSNVLKCVYGEMEDTPQVGGMYTMGLDIGRRDATVCTILEMKTNKVVDILRMQDMEWEDVLYDVAAMYHKWKPIHGYAECNFNDRIVEELVKNKGCVNLRPFFTASHSKQPMIENLIFQFTNESPESINHVQIKIPKHEQLIKELRAYSIRFKKGSQKPTYSGGNTNDDCVISLALASQSRKEKYRQGSNLMWEPI